MHVHTKTALAFLSFEVNGEQLEQPLRTKRVSPADTERLVRHLRTSTLRVHGRDDGLDDAGRFDALGLGGLDLVGTQECTGDSTVQPPADALMTVAVSRDAASVQPIGLPLCTVAGGCGVVFPSLVVRTMGEMLVLHFGACDVDGDASAPSGGPRSAKAKANLAITKCAASATVGGAAKSATQKQRNIGVHRPRPSFVAPPICHHRTPLTRRPRVAVEVPEWDDDRQTGDPEIIELRKELASNAASADAAAVQLRKQLEATNEAARAAERRAMAAEDDVVRLKTSLQDMTYELEAKKTKVKELSSWACCVHESIFGVPAVTTVATAARCAAAVARMRQKSERALQQFRLAIDSSHKKALIRKHINCLINTLPTCPERDMLMQACPSSGNATDDQCRKHW